MQYTIEEVVKVLKLIFIILSITLPTDTHTKLSFLKYYVGLVSGHKGKCFLASWSNSDGLGWTPWFWSHLSKTQRHTPYWKKKTRNQLWSIFWGTFVPASSWANIKENSKKHAPLVLINTSIQKTKNYRLMFWLFRHQYVCFKLANIKDNHKAVQPALITDVKWLSQLHFIEKHKIAMKETYLDLTFLARSICLFNRSCADKFSTDCSS